MADTNTNPLKRWRWLVWSEHGPARVTQRALLQVLFDYYATSKDGRVFPSQQTLSTKTGVCLRAVREHLDILEADGWFKRKKGGKSGQGWALDFYILTWPNHIDPKTDIWLKEVERNRIQARDDYRQDEGWQPENDEEAARWEEQGQG
ncbi:helix-turn-helix domain-containing protein [uncultured Thiodictyon sp.]|uniref:helix-turn-helix domain-containing protein n=1 Tax=uncultured Thiodictyon sp. TaxID=1846217 RepID=UPI0025CDBA4A|nr:helix-turn-helix domain-containing protein [uncultured Thiodictyon sp.]